MKGARNYVFALLIVSMFLLGFDSMAEEDAASPASPAPEDASMVGVYDGRMAAASGPGRVVSLALYANGAVRLGSDYLNGKDGIVEYGRWSVSDSGTAVVKLLGRLGVEAREYTPHQEIEFRLDGEELEATEYDEKVYGGEDFRLERVKAEPTPLLTDSDWELVEVLMMSGKRFVPEGAHRYSLTFDADGKVRGQSDCTGFSGAYSEVDAQLNMGSLSTDPANCPDDSLFELYVEALSRAESYGLEGDVLTIAFGPDAGILVFERKGTTG